jgi:predicted alpha/beta hydrolase family esterase
LAQALGPAYEVRFPKMPDVEHPRYERWKDRLAIELAAVDDGAILVGHSLGGTVLLKYLSENLPSRSIAGMFLVAMPYWGAPDWEIDEYALRDDFASRLPRIPRLFLYQSRDDDGVPFAHLSLYARALPDAVVRELDGYGHTFDRGCPELVKDIAAT